MAKRIWADPKHHTNRIRPRITCRGCGKKGCVTYWGPWCFECNVPRMEHLERQFERIAQNLEKLKPA
jgi:hypothetical protein